MEKRRFKGLALGLTVLVVLALTALVVLGVVVISLLRDYDKEETDEKLPAMQMNGNLVGTRAVTTTLPLLAATAMDMERLEQAWPGGRGAAIAPPRLDSPSAQSEFIGQVDLRLLPSLRQDYSATGHSCPSTGSSTRPTTSPAS